MSGSYREAPTERLLYGGSFMEVLILRLTEVLIYAYIYIYIDSSLSLYIYIYISMSIYFFMIFTS